MEKITHEPEAPVMSAEEAVEDAGRLAALLRRNLRRSEPTVQIKIPFSEFMAALDELNQEELILLRQRVDERLAT